MTKQYDDFVTLVNKMINEQDEIEFKKYGYAVIQKLSDYKIAKVLQDDFYNLLKNPTQSNRTEMAIMLQTGILPIIEKKGKGKVPKKTAWNQKK